MPHTPGPWRLSRAGIGISNYNLYRQDENTLTKIAEIYTSEAYPKITQRFFSDAQEAEANANLLMAAPDLLAVARNFRAMIISGLLVGTRADHDYLTQVSAAVARAEGRNP